MFTAKPWRIWKKLGCVIVVVYLVFTGYGAYILFSEKHRDTSETKRDKNRQGQIHIDVKEQFESLARKTLGPSYQSADIANETKALNVDLQVDKHAVEIWSRAGIGQYTWEHVLGATLEPRLGGIWRYGYKQLGNIKLTFRMGPGVVPNKVPTDVVDLILVLNGRAPDKVDFARTWLDHLETFPHLRNVALMLIGSEVCDNDWLLPYMVSHGGRLRFAFVVYDSPIVDNKEIYQWPLGVATYRGVPVVDSSQLNVRADRRYRCNFLGTIYPNSSRELLLNVIKENGLHDYCYVKTRESWHPAETDESRLEYERILSQSDLTLSPVGVNAECYRIYEACMYGSVPVVEDSTTHGNCAAEALRLLKRHKAPFIFIKDWRLLPKLLEEESRKSPREIAQRREELLRWYDDFRSELRDTFLSTVQESFFPT